MGPWYTPQSFLCEVEAIGLGSSCQRHLAAGGVCNRPRGGGREGEQLSTGRGAQGCGGPTQPAEPWPGSRPVVPCCLPQLGAQTPPGGSATAGWRQPSPLAQVLAEGTPATAATAQSAAGPPSCEWLGRTLAPPEGRAAGGEATVLVGGCVRPSADTAPWGEPGHPILTARTEPAPDGPHSGRLAVFLSTLNVGSAERVRALSVSGSLDGMNTQPARPWGATPRLPGGGGRGTQCARSTCFPPRSLPPRPFVPSFSLVPVSKAPGRSVGAFPTVWVGLVASCARSGPSVPCTAGVRRRGPVGSRDTWV